MKWEAKMNVVVKYVLGDRFKIIAQDDREFGIYMDDVKILNRHSVFSLDSHWRHQLSEAIKIIFEERIKAAMLKV